MNSTIEQYNLAVSDHHGMIYEYSVKLRPYIILTDPEAHKLFILHRIIDSQAQALPGPEEY
jgi:hypothetical protein